MGPASGQEVIPLTVIDAYAPTARYVRSFIDYYIPEVDRRLAETANYAIDWNKAFGGTVAKPAGVLEALQYGLADLGIVTTPFHTDKIPFHNISAVTPLVTADIGLVARSVDELVDRYPALRAAWDDYRQVYLTTVGARDTYQVFMAEPHMSLDDYRGRRISGAGLSLRYVEGLGVAAVSSDVGDFYNNVSTGLADGALAWMEAAVSYELYEVAPYMMDVRLGAVTSKVISVNRRTWERLPDELRAALAEVAIEYRDRLAAESGPRAALSRREFEARGGQIIPLSLEQRRAWAHSLPNMAIDWAEDLERRGLPGRQILRDYMDIMRDNKQPIVRHWDRE